jgi:hypothetical protein
MAVPTTAAGERGRNDAGVCTDDRFDLFLHARDIGFESAMAMFDDTDNGQGDGRTNGPEAGTAYNERTCIHRRRGAYFRSRFAASENS